MRLMLFFDSFFLAPLPFSSDFCLFSLVLGQARFCFGLPMNFLPSTPPRPPYKNMVDSARCHCLNFVFKYVTPPFAAVKAVDRSQALFCFFF